MTKIKHKMEIIKRGTQYFLKWSVTNKSNSDFHFKPGMLMINNNHPYIHTRYKQLNFTQETIIPANKTIVVLLDDLHPDKITNYRFYMKRYSFIGIEGKNSVAHLVTSSIFAGIANRMDDIAKEMNIYAEIDDGLFLNLDKQDEELAKIATQNGKINKNPQIISIEFQEAYSPNADKSENDVMIDDRRV